MESGAWEIHVSSRIRYEHSGRAFPGFSPPTLEFMRRTCQDCFWSLKVGLRIVYQTGEVLTNAGGAFEQCPNVKTVHVVDFPNTRHYSSDDKKALTVFIRAALSSKYLRTLSFDTDTPEGANAIAAADAFGQSRIVALEFKWTWGSLFWARMMDHCLVHPTLKEIHNGGSLINYHKARQNMLQYTKSAVVWGKDFAISLESPFYVYPFTVFEEPLRKSADVRVVFCGMNPTVLVKRMAMIGVHLDETDALRLKQTDEKDRKMMFESVVVIRGSRFKDGILPDFSACRRLRALRIIDCDVRFDDNQEIKRVRK